MRREWKTASESITVSITFSTGMPLAAMSSTVLTAAQSMLLCLPCASPGCTSWEVK